MADVYAIFGTLLALGIAFPGMLAAWWLLFPTLVGGAQSRLAQTPGRSLALGGGVLVLLGLPVAILLAMPSGVTKFLGAALIFLALAFASLGAAGLAAGMAERLLARGSAGLSELGAFLRAAVALELAAAFPFIGWFLVIPLTVVACLGASTFAVLRWLPRPRSQAATEPLPTRVVT